MQQAAATTLETHFDTAGWRLAERLAAVPERIYRHLQERHPGLVQQWDPAARSAQIPAEVRLACLGTIEELSAEQTLSAFAHAVAAGAHEVAGRLLEAVESQHDAASYRALHRHWLALGETARAAELAANNDEIFGDRGDTLNTVDISRQIDEGQLSPTNVAGLLLGRKTHVLHNPQLHLLAHRALLRQSPEGARQALNRYLRVLGSDRIARTLDSGHYLRDLELARPEPVRGGPLVSVLMSAFNAEGTIEYAVKSILDQSYRNLELLVCDDGSSDETVTTLRRRFGVDPRVRLYKSRTNQGTYNIRNALIAEAAGELITTHDADDIALPRRIEYQVAQLKSPEKQASVTNFLRVMPDGRIVFFRDRSANRMAIVSLMARRKTFEEMGPYRGVKFGADFEFLEMLKHRHGAQSIARVRSPQLLGLWAERSMTRSAQSEALAGGYRSAARRAYTNLVYLRRVLGDEAVEESQIAEILVPASEIDEI